MNHIVLMGRLTRDPELRQTQSGLPVASFTLAVDRRFAPKGQEQRPTDFIDIVAWRQQAEFVSKYFTKGQMCAVQGTLQIRDWQDREGNKRRSAEVVADAIHFTGSKKESGGGSGFAPSFDDRDAPPIDAGYNADPVGASDFAELDDDDGELPF